MEIRGPPGIPSKGGRQRPESSHRNLDREKGLGLTWALVGGSVDAISEGGNAFFKTPQGLRDRVGRNKKNPWRANSAAKLLHAHPGSLSSPTLLRPETMAPLPGPASEGPTPVPPGPTYCSGTNDLRKSPATLEVAAESDPK